MIGRLLCAMGWHRWKPRVRALAKPARNLSAMSLAAYWPIAFMLLGPEAFIRNHYTVGHQCTRCKRRKA